MNWEALLDSTIRLKPEDYTQKVHNWMTDSKSLKANCLDCGIPYEDFYMDTVLPDSLWLKIHPEGFNGLICVNCIQKRLRKIGETAMFCVSEENFKSLKTEISNDRSGIHQEL